MNATTTTPSFTPNVTGDYVVQLIVTDDSVPPLSSAPAFVTLSSYNQAPTANAQATPSIPIVKHVVSLDGTTSTDPENDVLTYAWTLTSRPAGSTAALLTPTSAMASIIPDLPGTYEVTLTVSEFLGAGTPETASFVASTAASYVESQVILASSLVQGLLPGQVTNKGNLKDIGKNLRDVVSDIQKGKYQDALKDLDDVIKRTDGFPLRQALDTKGESRDWITDATAQAAVYAYLVAARNELVTLIVPKKGDSDGKDDKYKHTSH